MLATTVIRKKKGMKKLTLWINEAIVQNLIISDMNFNFDKYVKILCKIIFLILWIQKKN